MTARRADCIDFSRPITKPIFRRFCTSADLSASLNLGKCHNSTLERRGITYSDDDGVAPAGRSPTYYRFGSCNDHKIFCNFYKYGHFHSVIGSIPFWIFQIVQTWQQRRERRHSMPDLKKGLCKLVWTINAKRGANLFLQTDGKSIGDWHQS